MFFRPILFAGAFAGVCSLALFAAGPAHAQGIASNAEEAQAGEEFRGNTGVVVIDEVVRGFYVSVDYGVNYYLPDPAFLNPDGTHPGTRMGIRVGYDILNNVQLDAFILANFNEGNLDTTKLSDPNALTGDLAHFAPGLALRFDFITSEDQRFFAFARAGAGYAFWFPSKLVPGGQSGSIHTDASLGIEYYPKLRHLSAGIEADFQALLGPNAYGFAVYPTLKYTF